MRQTRGVALIQALVIVAAIAAVATALLLRGDVARQRLQTRFQADQAALYLDSGADMIVSMLAQLPAGSVTHRGQDWARARDGIEIDRGVLAWRIDDQQSRFNVNTLYGPDPQHQDAREAFVRLATGQGLNRVIARRLADALGEDVAARTEAAGGVPIPWPLADPRQLAGIAASQPAAFADLLTLVAARPPQSPLNINTAHPVVLAAMLPQVPSTARRAVARYLDRDPAASKEALIEWIDQAFNTTVAAHYDALEFTTGSTLFEAQLEVRVDSLTLRRSVVLNRDAAPEQGAIVLSRPEPEP